MILQLQLLIPIGDNALNTAAVSVVQRISLTAHKKLKRHTDAPIVLGTLFGQQTLQLAVEKARHLTFSFVTPRKEALESHGVNL